MGRINAELIRAALPHASQAFLRLNGLANDTGTTKRHDTTNLDSAPGPQPQPDSGDAPHERPQIETFYSKRVRVSVTSHRCGVLCDPDNIIAKWHIDAALRYSRILSDDTTREIDLQILPEKRVFTKKEEGVEILISPLP